MKEKFVRFLKSNFIIWAFLAIMLIIELTGVCVTSGKFFIRRPFMFLSLLAVFTAVLFAIKSQRGRYWCAFVLMLVLFVLDLIFIVVFAMTGSTFDFSMLKLRADAMAIVESVPINFVYVLVSGLCISLYMLLARHYIKIAPAPARILPRAAVAGIMTAVLAFHGCMAYTENRHYNPADLSYKLYDANDSSYYDRGILGNFVDELYKGAFFNKVGLGDENELENFIYDESKISKPTSMFGKAEGYNVVTVLAESFEWFSFMAGLPDAGLADAYPGGFKVDESVLRTLYPNLYELYDTSTVCLNHHSREKTDISENQSIIGNYPTNCFINYDYTENTVPYSVPNIMRELFGVQSLSFHNGVYTFYNRNIHHENVLGFKKFYASEQMAELHPETFTNYEAETGERNLDSEMIAACKEEMFPADRRFNTYITSITMHGQFANRENLAPHYQTLFDAGIADDYADETRSLEDADPFIHYAACALEFDKAIGEMLSYLKNTKDGEGTPLINKTLIVLFGDHNAYYQTLSNDVKNLYLNEENGRNYTDLFRVPMMVRIGNQTEQKLITKFTTTTDIVPTILDLLGVKFYGNILYGSSIYGDEESIIYSRAYDVFITDKLFFSSLNNIKYRAPDVTDEYINTIKQKALVLLDKTSHVNRIFYYDFLSGEREKTFYNKLKELNA